jgi:chaperonin GroES
LLKPIKNNIIVELIQKENVTASGIVLTSTNSEEASRGKVIAIGPKVLDIKEGDTVLPNWNKATKTKYNNQELYIVSEEEIVLIF